MSARAPAQPDQMRLGPGRQLALGVHGALGQRVRQDDAGLRPAAQRLADERLLGAEGAEEGDLVDARRLGDPPGGGPTKPELGVDAGGSVQNAIAVVHEREGSRSWRSVQVSACMNIRRHVRTGRTDGFQAAVGQASQVARQQRRHASLTARSELPGRWGCRAPGA
jgi:hypothetical protein